MLLRRALSKVPVDVVFTGDYQPAERKFLVSLRMLEVCRDLGFPVFVLERSPLVLRDIDLLQDINYRAPSVVAFSILTTPDAPSCSSVREIERLAPAPAKRFAAMEQFANAGLLTGTCLMPVLPGISDDDATLESVVRWTADHGGRFVLAGALTLSDQQRDYFSSVVDERMAHLRGLYRLLYPAGSYAPAGDYHHRLGQRVRDLCLRHGLVDRIPRPIIPGDRRALNKRVVERLADQAYALELEGAPRQRVWAYRKAAWAIEDLPHDVGLVYRQLGLKGLRDIPAVGASLAPIIEPWISPGVAGNGDAAAAPGQRTPG